jgi:hypothetical protein
MRRVIVLSSVLGVLIIPAAASANVTPHTCGAAGGAVTASGYTSCGFARNVVSLFRGERSRGSRVVRGVVYSPATGKSYGTTCRGALMSGDIVNCTSSGTDSWVRFFYFPRRNYNIYMPLNTIGMPECGGG